MNPSFDRRRRRLVTAALAAAAGSVGARLSFAAGSHGGDRRLVFVILRGGLDGLSAVPPVGDPDFAPARGPLGQFAMPALPLGGAFALHPLLGQLHAMYGRGELAVIHAVGLPYRERSHFDAQQVLESGGARPYELTTGWLGRALGINSAKGLALNTAVPLVLRGEAVVDSWAPSALPDPSLDFVERLQRMYAEDPGLARALRRARALHLGSVDGTAGADDMSGIGNHRADPNPPGAANDIRTASALPALARRAAEFLVQPEGPQAAVLEVGGWDTHANQANPNGPLANGLRRLDAGLAALREGLVAGGAWKRTVVVVATEFGREVAVNGTLGTDHGTGGMALVLGGAVDGGKVKADWPGLAKKDRFEGRDLRTTTDLRSVLKGVLADHLQLSRKALDNEVLPGSAAIKPMGLFG